MNIQQILVFFDLINNHIWCRSPFSRVAVDMYNFFFADSIKKAEGVYATKYMQHMHIQNSHINAEMMHINSSAIWRNTCGALALSEIFTQLSEDVRRRGAFSRNVSRPITDAVCKTARCLPKIHVAAARFVGL